MPRSIIIAKSQTTDDAVQALPLLLGCWQDLLQRYQVGLKPIGLLWYGCRLSKFLSYHLSPSSALERGKRRPRNTTFGKVSPPLPQSLLSFGFMMASFEKCMLTN